MILSTAYSNEDDNYPELCQAKTIGGLGWQVRITSDQSAYAYVTADEAERMATAWAGVAAEIRDRESGPSARHA